MCLEHTLTRNTPVALLLLLTRIEAAHWPVAAAGLMVAHPRMRLVKDHPSKLLKRKVRGACGGLRHSQKDGIADS